MRLFRLKNIYIYNSPPIVQLEERMTVEVYISLGRVFESHWGDILFLK